MITFACRELFSNPLNLRSLDILHDTMFPHTWSLIHHLSQLSQQLVVSSLLPSECLVEALIEILILNPPFVLPTRSHARSSKDGPEDPTTKIKS